jgi:UDP:flavonoid glycosyltransferase YjiC (YdhE family)
MVEGRGLDFYPIRGDAQALMGSPAGLSLAESGSNVYRTLKAILGSFGALAEGYAQDLSSKILRQTDVIINQLPGSLFGFDLAEATGAEYYQAAVMPLTRTNAFPLSLFPRFSLGRMYNHFTYRLAEQMAWQPFRRLVNRWRREAFGLPDAPFWGHYGYINSQTVPGLNGFSPHVVPPPSDWGDHIHTTGYWFSDPDPSDWHPSDELSSFIDAGPPPVFIGFGSIMLRDPEGVTALLLEALRMSGQRGVLSAGWGGIGFSGEQKDIFKIEYVPYNWLFPRMAAVVHHGGSGTTAAGLRAGVPTIILPFVMDQFYWGQRVYELGVGPQPIPYRKLSAVRLAQAITSAVNDSNIRNKAFELGVQIRSENGVGQAVEIITRQPNTNGVLR